MSESYIGQIRMFAGNFAPAGWALCDGQLVAIADYEALFNLIGTTYGGDGQSTFALPDLRGRVPLHPGSGFVIGQTAGTESVTLNLTQIPAHSHALSASSQSATTNAPNGVSHATTSSGNEIYAPPGSVVPMAANVVGNVGGSQPHDNMAPFQVVNFIIATEGIFPTPS